MINQQSKSTALRLGLPKGRMQNGVEKLLAAAGIELEASSRGYRPSISLPGIEVKVLKPQNIVEMLHLGSRDIGFAGADWVAELDGELIEMIDTKLDPVRLVAAAPEHIASSLHTMTRPILVASEYVKLAERWTINRKLDAVCIRSYGATEVFPPEDADCIIDNSSSGATLTANALTIVDTLMTSSTRLYANPRSLEDPSKRESIEHFALLVESVLEARRRVMLELNVAASALEAVVRMLPSMRKATVASLHGNQGFAVKAAVCRSVLPTLIPQLKQSGGTDIIISSITQIVP